MKPAQDTRPFLGLITALDSETRALCGRSRIRRVEYFLRTELRTGQGRVVCLQCGPGPERTLAAGRSLVAEGAGALLCCGVSSGIDSTAPCGGLCLGETVALLHEGKPLDVPIQDRLPVESALLLLRGLRFKSWSQPLLTTPAPLLDPAERKLWHEQTGAAALDTESAGAALAALEAGLPFLAARAISDSVSRPVSPEMVAACDAGGSSLGLIRAVLRRPSLFRDFWQAGQDYARALDTLKLAREALFTACFQSIAAGADKPAQPLAHGQKEPGSDKPIQ